MKLICGQHYDSQLSLVYIKMFAKKFKLFCTTGIVKTAQKYIHAQNM